jgi:zinc/manganese transport system permease protein
MMAAPHVIAGVTDIFSHPFIRYGFAAGTFVAVAAGLTGYFLVLRAQVFTADALSHVAFTGALAALAFGVDVRLGLFAASVFVALLLGAIGPRGRADDVVIGSVFAWVLGLGVLFLSIFTTDRATGNSAAGVNVLFGSIFGLDERAALVACAIAAGVVVALLAIARPLLFASIDEAVARSRGVPVRLLGFGFLALVGVTAAEATQVTGALLLLGLVAGPAATASRLTDRPYLALALSAAIAAASVWLGLVVSYAVPKAPPSFSIVAIITATYVLVALGQRRSNGPHLRMTRSSGTSAAAKDQARADALS